MAEEVDPYAEARARAEEEFGCDCSAVEVRFRIYRNGQKVYVNQCLRCGKLSDALKAVLVPFKQRHYAAEADPAPGQEWQRRKWERVHQLIGESREAERREERLDRQERYHEYLRSLPWKRRRDAVMKRSGGLCESCLYYPATEVHHKTYEHLFNEPLFDLVAVCGRCHRLITQMDRERRGK